MVLLGDAAQKRQHDLAGRLEILAALERYTRNSSLRRFGDILAAIKSFLQDRCFDDADMSVGIEIIVRPTGVIRRGASGPMAVGRDVTK